MSYPRGCTQADHDRAFDDGLRQITTRVRLPQRLESQAPGIRERTTGISKALDLARELCEVLERLDERDLCRKASDIYDELERMQEEEPADGDTVGDAQYHERQDGEDLCQH